MSGAASLERMALEPDQRISDVVEREQSRLRNFIRRRVPDSRDAEDILQDVFYELVEANRLLMPIEHVTGWLSAWRGIASSISSARESRRASALPPSRATMMLTTNCKALTCCHRLMPVPEALYARSVLLHELELAVDELPEEQRKVFVAHELEGRSFKEIAAETGVSVNTLLSRKRYAVLHLRERLQSIYDEFTKG